MQRLRFDIKGLDCPHCAAKLEKLIKDSEPIQDANLNYAMSALTVDVADDADEDLILKKLQAVADAFEDGITIDFRD